MTFWAAGASLGAGLIGGALQSKASKRAAQAQAEAVAKANAVGREQLGNTESRNAPFYQGGLTGLQGILDGIGSGKFGQAPTQQQVMSEPGYQFGLDQGMSALNRYQNAHGLNGSGAQLKAAARYGTDYATTKYGEAFDRNLRGGNQAYQQLSGLAGAGQNAGFNTNAAGNAFAQQAGQNYLGGGNAQAANSLAQGNIWSNVLNQGASTFGRTMSPSAFSPYNNGPTANSAGGPNASGWGTGSAYGNRDFGGYL